MQNSKTMYVASAENYLLKNGVLQKVWDCLETLNQETEGGLRHLTQKKKEPMWRRASVLDKQGQESGWMSELFGQVVDNPRKLRGVRLEYLLFEECFGKSTKVVMSDFSIKNIEDIIIGDFVLGIDGKPKEVMRTCTGIDDLYLVKQKKGFDYIVNSKHKLYFESRPRVNNMPDEIKLITAKEYNDLSSYHKSILYGIKSNPIKDIPFTEIKGNQIPNDYLETSNKLSTGIDSIEYIGKGEYFGITLKSYGDEQTDNLFLLEDFTIVHNCGSFNGLVTVYNQSEALVNLLGKKIGTRILWGRN